MTFLLRHIRFSCTDQRRAWATVKAMREYRRTHPTCELTGTSRNVEVHHIAPIERFPALAADPSNFISLSKPAHLTIGHAGNYRTYVIDPRSIIYAIKRQVERNTNNKQEGN